MQELSGKQRRFLRRLGQTRKAIITVGKAGLSDATIRRIGQLLEMHELVKLRLPAGLARERKQMAELSAQATNAACVQLLGRIVLLYRPSRQLDLDERIVLPC